METSTKRGSLSRKVALWGENSLHKLFAFAGNLRLSRRTPRLGEVDSVLLKHFGAIGDFILLTATLPSYRRLFPKAKITLLAKSEIRDFASRNPNIDEVIPIDLRRFRKSVLAKYRFWRVLLSRSFDLAINLDYSAHYDRIDRAVFTWVNGCRKVAFENNVPGLRRDYSVYTELVMEREPWLFEVYRNNLMASYLGFENPTMRPHLPEIDPQRRDKLISESVGSLPYYVVSPGAQDRRRCWPAERFAEVMNELKNRGYTPVLTGTPADVDIARTIGAHYEGHFVDLVGKTSLTEVTALISKAAFVVSNESAPAHISAALGVLCFVILGGGDHGRFMPYPIKSSITTIENKEFEKCFRCSWCCIYSEWRCVLETKAEIVLDAITKRLDELDPHAHT